MQTTSNINATVKFFTHNFVKYLSYQKAPTNIVFIKLQRDNHKNNFSGMGKMTIKCNSKEYAIIVNNCNVWQNKYDKECSQQEN